MLVSEDLKMRSYTVVMQSLRTKKIGTAAKLLMTPMTYGRRPIATENFFQVVLQIPQMLD